MQISEEGFIRNSWYAVALAGKVDRAPVQAWLLGEPVVLFRKESGTVVALRDRCPHRHAPLSMGRVVGDEIQCRYHGFQFDSSGRCSRIPGEATIPAAIRVERFPVAEALGFIWIWPGEAAAASAALLPAFPWLEQPEFLSYYITAVIAAPAALIVDNLMDLTHVHFVHRLLGADNLVHESAAMRAWESGDRVFFQRNLKQAQHAGTDSYLQVGGEFIAPSAVITSGVQRREGSDEVQPGPMSQVLHCLTPRTAESTLYLAVKCWNLSVRPHEVVAMQHQIEVTVGEDKEIMEAQYRNRCIAHPVPEEKLVKADRAAVLARRLHERLLRNERAGGAQSTGEPLQAAGG
jgi:vanillate O-demethylase monooxygenase subunit